MINCNSFDDIFSNINTLKFIDLSNFKNDKIISSIFNNGSINILYVCQEDEIIITNPNSRNCCTFNFTTNDCDLSSNIKDPEEPDTSDTGGGGGGGGGNGGNKSSGISIGVIVFIVAGVVVIISIIILIICWYKRKKKLSETSKQIKNELKDSNTTTNIPLEKSQISKLTATDSYEYEPQDKNSSKKVKIKLETTSQSKIEIIIAPEKTMTELIQFYFKIINQPTLYGDSSIRFLMNANLIMHDSKYLIKTYINPKSDTNIIVIDDLDDKIKQNLTV